MAEEYIKKEDAIQSVMNHDLLKSDWSRAWAEYMLEDAPTADVAPVVRCRDCKHCEYAWNRIPTEQAWVCYKLGIDVEQDWFCADGERREDEDR